MIACGELKIGELKIENSHSEGTLSSALSLKR
jgi:hypothetical protein